MFACSWLIYLKCMMMPGLAEFKQESLSVQVGIFMNVGHGMFEDFIGVYNKDGGARISAVG